MHEKFDHNDKAELLSADRYESTDPQRLISMLPILVYHEVADIGCGPGFFTIPLAKYLFDGRVYAVDVQQEMLDATQEQVKAVNLTNVELKLAGENELPLEDDSLDGAFIAFVLHETEAPATMLAEARRCLRKGGWLAALEHKQTAEDGPPKNRRLDEGEVRAMAQEQGFRVESSHNMNDHHYMLIMRK